MLLKKIMLGILATSLITGWTGDTHLNKLKEDVTKIQTNVPKFVNTFDTLKKKFDEFAQNANNKIGQANQIIEDKVQYINWLHEKLDQAAQENNQEKQRVKTLQEDSDKLKQQLKSTEDKLKEYKKQIDTLLLEQELVNLYENGSLRESVDQDTLDRLRDKINQFGTEQKAQLLKKWEQAQVSFLKNLIQKVEYIDGILYITFKNDDYLNYGIYLYRNGKYHGSIKFDPTYGWISKDKNVQINESTRTFSSCRLTMTKCEQMISPTDDYHIEVARLYWDDTRIVYRENYIVYRKGDSLNSTQKKDEKDQSEFQIDQLQGGPESLKQQLETKDEQIQKLEQEKQKLETQMNQLQGGPESLKQQLETKDEQIQKLEQEKQKLETQMDQLQREPENLKQQLEMKDEQIQKLEQEKQKLETQMNQLQGGPENLKQQLERKDKQIQELMTAKATWEKEKTELEKKLKAAEDKMERQTESDAKNTST
ncbi:hypothetical protein ACRS6Y_13340 [Bacillus cytotoxicus]|uniref:Chromosome segregation ATPase-like protein n=4 Tax=Bacillus cytotoxicus TaxID=580165 RepID=A7GUM7_BACCN|nr:MULTISPECIES: chromosome segregation ATPase-like protein [Bacillus cereus group]ABS23835.1 Chromosome segregation ATPase-like protein [Bacillus cytotoxicus NVH 391-98]AWC46439.1 hypothetical protein CG479_019370 [Bacillus cytotoxicus]MDH2865162.1 hypothetical protein [Bacillus cytotoxicus]MDH2884956.1 hypothetical protein [Bacillus cytotoxicus]QTR84248.1 hypothetical protein JC777_07380 [Bacillus cytotoxicus]